MKSFLISFIFVKVSRFHILIARATWLEKNKKLSFGYWKRLNYYYYSLLGYIQNILQISFNLKSASWRKGMAKLS